MNTTEDRKTLAVDFDGVIHAYRRGWQDGTIYDPPVPGVRDALRILQQTYEIVIFTTCVDSKIVAGLPQDGQLGAVHEWLQTHQIPFDRVHHGTGKPIASLYIDDNALRFTGDWPQTLREVRDILGPSESG